MFTPGARRLVPLFLLLSTAWMAGCSTTSAAPSTPPTVSQFQPVGFDATKDTLALDSTLALAGKVTDDQGLKSWTLTILDSASKVLDTADASSITGNSFSFDQTTTNLHVINIGSWGPAGTYTVRLTVTNINGDAVHSDLKIRAKGTGNGTTLLSSQGVRKMGAQGATPGSFLDVTRDSVWTSGPKPYAHIDLVFGTDADGVLSLMSPSAANADGFDLSAWSTWNSTSIVFYSASTPLLTAVAVQTAIDSSGAVSQKVPVQAGWYAVYLSTGTYAALKLSSISSSVDTATVDVEIFE